MGDRKKQTKEKTPLRIPIEPDVVIHDGETTNRPGETDAIWKESGQEILGSNEQIASLQNAFENGFTSMASLINGFNNPACFLLLGRQDA